MILAATLLILDMFGLQVARIGDVTQDGIDELVITDPCGETKRARAGRVLIVDPTNWRLVHAIAGADDDSRFGIVCSVART